MLNHVLNDLNFGTGGGIIICSWPHNRLFCSWPHNRLFCSRPSDRWTAHSTWPTQGSFLLRPVERLLHELLRLSPVVPLSASAFYTLMHGVRMQKVGVSSSLPPGTCKKELTSTTSSALVPPMPRVGWRRSYRLAIGDGERIH
jgi:hypothetical protein